MSGAFDAAEKRALAGQARTLGERLRSPDAVTGEREEDAVDDLLAAWRGQFPDEAAFERRLAREDRSEAECRDVLAATRLVVDEPIPAWVERLDDLVAAVQARSATPPADDRPFGELSAAVAAAVRDRLPGVVHDALSQSAVDALAAWFRERFERRFVRVLYVECKTFVAVHDRTLAHADPTEFDDPPTEYYERFVDYLRSGGFADLCLEYPMFGRLLATQARQFEAHLVEFARRLDADRAALAERFGAGGDPGAVTALDPLADETHSDGRVAMRVAFESGLTVAYRPRSVDADERFHALLGRLDDHLPGPDLRTPSSLARDGYGWTEWVEHADCGDEAAVERYYRRAGALVCVAALLGFEGCRFGSVVPAGEHPVLVDAATALHPAIGAGRRPVRTGVGALRDDGVLATGLVPFEATNVNPEVQPGLSRAVAGIPAAAEPTGLDGRTEPAVTAPNTDVMAVTRRAAQLDRRDRLPAVDGDPRPPAEFLDAIVEGFEGAYDAILELRDDGRLADEVGLPGALAGLAGRAVYRPTVRYGAVLDSLRAPACLRDGARFGVVLEGLATPFCDGRVRDPPWALFDAERRALARLDVPRFAARTDEVALRADGQALGVTADASGATRVRRRIAAADPADRREQVELLRGCFGAAPDPARESGGWPTANRQHVADDALVAEAESLLAAVRESALWTDGTPHWAAVPSPVGKDGLKPLTMRPADGSLFNGRCGVALFAAGLHRVTGEESYRTFALDALAPLREAIRVRLDEPALRSLGGAAGVGSVAYGLGAVGDLLDEPALLDDAVAAADFLTDGMVAADDDLDVIGGSAGTVLGLLGLHDRRSSPDLVAAAAGLGDHLLDARVEVDGVRAWRTVTDSPPVPGFAYGCSGVAYALGRLWDATGEAAYRDAALEAVAYEADAYDPDAGNWPDLRAWKDDAYPDQWCYGRSGVGLARLAMADYVADDRVDRGFERAVETFPDSGLAPFDHLCCGDAGRASFLLEAARHRSRREGAARRLLGGVLERKHRAGTYRTLTRTRELVDPSLFHGLSGIGYAMLRVVEPTLPCVLRWE